MNDPFDPKRLEISHATNKADLATPATHLPRHRDGEKFLKGPIPWEWLSRAGALPGKALHVGIALWHLAALNRSRTFRLSRYATADLGVQRDARARGLKALEGDGLISVRRRDGCLPVVTLCDVHGEAGGDN